MKNVKIGSHEYILKDQHIENESSHWHFVNEDRKVSLIVYYCGAEKDANFERILNQIKFPYDHFLLQVLDEWTNVTARVSQAPFTVSDYEIICSKYLNPQQTSEYYRKYSIPGIQSYKYQIFTADNEHLILEITHPACRAACTWNEIEKCDMPYIYLATKEKK